MNRRRFLLSAGAGATVAATGGTAWYAYDGNSLYMQENGPYSAWREWRGWRQRKDVPGPGPAVLLRSAVLASSPHNTQPWRFRVGESSVQLFLDPRRRVEGLDPFLREAYIGLGCALENVALAAGAHGLRDRTNVPDGLLASQPAEALRMVAQVDLDPGPRLQSALYGAIPNRHTNRGLYDPGRELPAGFIEQLSHL